MSNEFVEDVNALRDRVDEMRQDILKIASMMISPGEYHSALRRIAALEEGRAGLPPSKHEEQAIPLTDGTPPWVIANADTQRSENMSDWSPLPDPTKVGGEAWRLAVAAELRDMRMSVEAFGEDLGRMEVRLDALAGEAESNSTNIARENAVRDARLNDLENQDNHQDASIMGLNRSAAGQADSDEHPRRAGGAEALQVRRRQAARARGRCRHPAGRTASGREPRTARLGTG